MFATLTTTTFAGRVSRALERLLRYSGMNTVFIVFFPPLVGEVLLLWQIWSSSVLEEVN